MSPPPNKALQLTARRLGAVRPRMAVGLPARGRHAAGRRAWHSRFTGGRQLSA
jgi:hypothetical protein